MPTYHIPPALTKVAHTSNFCIPPQEFVIKNFQIWNPDAHNNRSITISFDYSDDSVMPAINTKCQLNHTSVNVGAKGLTPRYACDDVLVKFMWTNGTLTVIEKACPQETLSLPHEATGVLMPRLNCVKTTMNDCNVEIGRRGRFQACCGDCQAPRASRLVDISYCVGTAGTGIAPPFACGYIAVDHGRGRGRWRPMEESGVEEEEEEEEDRGGVKEIIVAFRGTYSITNAIVDLGTVPQEYVPYPAPPEDGDGDGGECRNCTVHMGFMASWRTARRVVIPALEAARERHPGYRVHLMGHSLGGAVAALAALELRTGLGWRDLADYINRAFGLEEGGAAAAGGDLAYRRVTHAGDPVPLLPLSEWGYRAHAGEIYIGKPDLPPAPGDLTLCRGNDDPRCLGGAETPDWLGWVSGWTKRGKVRGEAEALWGLGRWFPARLRLWQLLFAHRDYFWRLGLCVPGGDPTDWGRDKYNVTADGAQDETQDL
ncbi:hypothetical protein VTH06DRAFT_502 [Thermothelomyces fergusii]